VEMETFLTESTNEHSIQTATAANAGASHV
jgi:hypothetical protein